MVVPAREPASLGTTRAGSRVVLRWGGREGKRRLGAAFLLSSVMVA